MRWTAEQVEAHKRRMRRGTPDSVFAPAKAKRQRRPQEDKANLLREQLRLAGLTGWQGEFRFHPTRMWRLDVAFPVERLAVEIEGLGKRGGEISRHQRADGFEADCEKYAELAVLGWRLIRCTSKQVKNGMALDWIHRARLEART